MKYLPSLFAFCSLVTAGTAFAAVSSVDGILRDAEGAPLAGAQIGLQNGDGRLVANTTTDAAGHYVFSGVPADSYSLTVTQKDRVLGSALVSVMDGHDAHKDLSLADGQALHIVIARKRQYARNDLSPKTGSNAYAFDQKAIEALPLGGATSFNKILLQAPGVAGDSAASGNLHIRGEHANLQYRLNGILLPEGLSGFGDTLDSHIIENVTLLDGALPAQYGFRTAGVVDITTKNGFQNSGLASFMGGSSGTLQPSVSYGGSVGDADFFVAASHLSSDLGIENTTRSADAIHDHTEQNKQFGYASAPINALQRVEIVAGNSISYYQIPNNPGQETGGYQINGSNSFDSALLNERQFESNQYATLAWQGHTGDVLVQMAPFVRHSEIHFRPDEIGDLMFNGVSSDVKKTDLAAGLQNDNSWKINGAHTLRAGFSVQNDHVQNDNRSLAFLTDAGGTPLTDGSGNTIISSPIIDSSTKDGQLYGVYLQDEWKATDRLTINYGARFDQMEAYVSANQFSPRVGFVYKANDATTFHAGYARTFTPPPLELVSNNDISRFANTTNAPAITQNDAVRPERSHSFDAGVTQKLGEHWQLALGGYYKLVRDALDEGQFGSALILTPFNYERAHIYGTEFSASYTGEKLRSYFNFAFSRAMGKNVVSSQFNFDDPDEVAYIADHYVHLDHDQTFTASAGASYDVAEDTTLGIDGRFGSGLRRGFANTEHVPAYATFDLSAEQKLHLFPHDETVVRLSLLNVLDSAYVLRDGSGIGVGAPQWGARRGAFVTVSQRF